MKPAGHGDSLDDPEGSPSAFPTSRCLRFPFGFGPVQRGFFPARLSPLRTCCWVAFGFPRRLAFGFPRRREWKIRPSPPQWQLKSPIVFRDLYFSFRDPL